MRAIVKQKQLFTSSEVLGSSTAVTVGTFTTFDNSPALTFTPISSGQYRVWTCATAEQNSNPVAVVLRIFNTSGGATLISETQACSDIISGASIAAYPLEAVYQLTAGVTYVFDIQGKNFNPPGNINMTGVEAPFCMYAEQVI
jgi:hypothetical protein